MQIPQLDYKAPFEITKGGTYKVNARSVDAKPTILISTSEPVIIEDSILVGSGEDIIKCYGYTDLIVRRTQFYADVPFSSGSQIARAINNYGPRKFVFENNHLEHTAGILVDRWNGLADQILSIRFNRIVNTDKRKGDGNPGSHRAAIQFNTVRGLTKAEIAWNEIINKPKESWVEDCINIYNSSGTAKTPLLIHNNFIYGAFPVPLDEHFTGSGITVDGSAEYGGTYETTSAFINAFDNQVLATGNAAMNIAIGHDVHFYKNRMVSCGTVGDGQFIKTWAGCCIFNGSKLGNDVFRDNSIKDNVIGFNVRGQNYPTPGRQDEMDDRRVNKMPRGENTHLPDPITMATEAKEFITWSEKLVANKISLGLSSPPVVDVPVPTLTLKLGQKAMIKVTPLNKAKEPITNANITINSNSNDVFIVHNPKDSVGFGLETKGEGTGFGVIQVVSESGKSLYKEFKITVMAADVEEPTFDNELDDFLIEFTIL